MSNDKKTIGPMTLDGEYDWVLSRDPTNGNIAWICGDILRERFNIPGTARKLWITLTKRQPKHGDAIRVRFCSRYSAILDNDPAGTVINAAMIDKTSDFGNDFCATIHYA